MIAKSLKGVSVTMDKVCCMRNEVFLELAWSCQNYFSFLILVALQSEDEFGGHCTLSSALDGAIAAHTCNMSAAMT